MKKNRRTNWYRHPYWKEGAYALGMQTEKKMHLRLDAYQREGDDWNESAPCSPIFNDNWLGSLQSKILLLGAAILDKKC